MSDTSPGLQLLFHQHWFLLGPSEADDGSLYGSFPWIPHVVSVPTSKSWNYRTSNHHQVPRSPYHKVCPTAAQKSPELITSTRQPGLSVLDFWLWMGKDIGMCYLVGNLHSWEFLSPWGPSPCPPWKWQLRLLYILCFGEGMTEPNSQTRTWKLQKPMSKL